MAHGPMPLLTRKEAELTINDLSDDERAELATFDVKLPIPKGRGAEFYLGLFMGLTLTFGRNRRPGLFSDSDYHAFRMNAVLLWLKAEPLPETVQ